jgi:predicted transcriptional regulator
VTEFNVRYWHKQKIALKNTNKSRKAFWGLKSGKFPELEGELLEYVLGLRKDGCSVLHEMLHFKASELATKRGISRTDLKVSRGWITRFMQMKGLSLRRQTSLCQRMPKYLFNYSRIVTMHLKMERKAV